MSYLKDREYELGAKLKHYASGDGSISFVWDMYGTATGDRVTMKDAQAFMAENFDYFDGWKLLDRYGLPHAYQPCERVDAKTIKWGEVARYYRYAQISEQHFVVFHILNDEEFPVQNLNTIGRIKFFVNNEDLIRGSK